MKKLLILFLFILIPLRSSADLFYQIDRSTYCAGKQVMGRIEKVNLLEKNLILNAKLDTGATMSSLSAEDIKIFEHNHTQWVRFTIYIELTREKVIFTKPLVRYTDILKRSEEGANKNDTQKYSKRPVINLLVCLGNQKKNILINLIDRTQFRYPLLLGANALRNFKVLVDVDHNYLSFLRCSNPST